MADLLVKLYALPDPGKLYEDLASSGITIKRVIPPERHVVRDWVAAKFPKAWASECEAAFSRLPCSCFVALKDGKIAGFACYDATCKGFFGPVGVDEAQRKAGLGKALTLRTLEAMREAGYGYAIIGWAASAEFFRKAAGASVIEGSEPGVYRNMLKG
ncbi:MAG TPA: GNAT family N-acetyltransferase [Elusimicrobiales bacterium]|nr:GNAT family N-acetyltransferase [Elusimicrobiales bacterium]